MSQFNSLLGTLSIGNITSHKLLATNTQEPLFSEWVDAITKRILDDPSCLDDIEDETELSQLDIAELTCSVMQTAHYPSMLYHFLTENPSITYKLIGTSVIEEGYFDANN